MPPITFSNAGVPVKGGITPQQADWIARSTAVGVTFATDFSGPHDFDNPTHTTANGNSAPLLARIVKDVTDGIPGTKAGCCLKINWPAGDPDGSPAWFGLLNPTWTLQSQGIAGAPFYIQFRSKIPLSRYQSYQCATFTASASGTVLTISSMTTGTIYTGQVVLGTGFGSTVRIASFGTGSGGTGTYNLDNNVGTVASGPMSTVRTDSSGGFKLCIVGGYNNSNPISSQSDIANEIVALDSNYRAYPTAYGHTGTSSWDGHYDIFQDPFSSVYSSTDFKQQNAIDRGPGSPDQAHRYCLYSQEIGANAATGLSDPTLHNVGAFPIITDTWMTYLLRINYQTVGGQTGNEFDMWCAQWGDTSYTKIATAPTGTLPCPADATYTNGPNGIYLIGYDTNAAASGQDTYQKWAQLICSTSNIPCPQAY